MESLLFAKQACEDRRKHLQGVQATPAAAPKTDDNIPQLPMRFVLKNSTTMTYFQEYMTEKNALHVLDCWADITHWRNKAVRAKAKVDKVCCQVLSGVVTLVPHHCTPLLNSVQTTLHTNSHDVGGHCSRSRAEQAHYSSCSQDLLPVPC
jgi:hypothetical protein